MATTTAATDRAIRRDIAHLARRAGFGLHADEVEALAALGYEAAVDELVGSLTQQDAAADAVPAPAFDTAAYLAARRSNDPAQRREARDRLRADRRALIGWVVQRMVGAQLPTREKLTFLWHDFFATSAQKVRITELLYGQYRMLYTLGPGRFDDLVSAVARDPAMLIWLDGRENTAEAPNENFARELFELFTLGHGVHDHESGRVAQPYTETDVAEAARALTGWTISAEGAGVLVPRRHDRGTKTVLGRTGALALDDIVDIAVNGDTCAPHVVARLWSRMGRPADAEDDVVQELAAGFAEARDVQTLLRRMFLHEAFRDADTRVALVKMPVEYVVGTLRALRLAVFPAAIQSMIGCNQVPFFPPDVAGWPANGAWLSTSSAQVRLEFATNVAQRADLSAIASETAADRPAAVARLLGVDEWSDATAETLAGAAGDHTTLLTLALVAPEYLLA